MDHRLQRTISSPSPELDPSSAFELFFELEYERVFGAIYLATGSRRDAEDLTQRAFLRTWERWDHVGAMERPSLFPLRWALGTVRTALHRERASFGRLMRRDPRLEPFEDVRLDEGVRHLIVGLSRRERGAIALVRGLGLTPGEAGSALGRRASTIRSDVSVAEASVQGWVEQQRVGIPTPEDGHDPVVAVIDAVRHGAEPVPGAFDRHLGARIRRTRRRRITTVALVVVLGALIASTAGRGSEAVPPPGPSTSDRATSQVAAERIRLPGLLMRASAAVPDGWEAGESIWGADGPGVAAFSTGSEGARVSVAVFDLILLSPFDPATDHIRALTANGREGWFAGFRRSFDHRTRARLVGDESTNTRRFRVWDPLAWVLARAPARGAIHVSQPRIDEREGSLVSFVQTDQTTELFSVYREGTIAMRPGVTYSFWAPANGESLAGALLIGIAREPGATPGQEWAVIDGLNLRRY